MKKTIASLLAIASMQVVAVNDQMPPTRTITSISTYGDMVIVRFTPEYQDTQGCTGTNNKRLEFTFDSTKGKEMYAQCLQRQLANIELVSV